MTTHQVSINADPTASTVVHMYTDVYLLITHKHTYTHTHTYNISGLMLRYEGCTSSSPGSLSLHFTCWITGERGALVRE